MLIKSSTNSSPIIESRPFDYVPETGIRTTFHYHEDGSVSFEKVQDAEALLDFNREQFNAAPESWRGDLHKVASIPIHVYHELVAQGITKDQKRFAQWLNDSGHIKLRTKAGNI